MQLKKPKILIKLHCWSTCNFHGIWDEDGRWRHIQKEVAFKAAMKAKEKSYESDCHTNEEVAKLEKVYKGFWQV